MRLAALRLSTLVLLRFLVHASLLPNANKRTVSLSRRESLGCGLALGLWHPTSAVADAKGGVQWSIELADTFEVQRQLTSIVRIKTETMLLADDASTGAQAKLLLLPFGQQAGASLSAEEQLALATFFFDQGALDEKAADGIAAIMATSAARSPSVVSLSQTGASKVYSNAGRRFLRYQYAADKCIGEVDGGECLGSLTKRRAISTVTMSSISQYRTNTERQRMQELGQVRNVQVLWLLTLSAPDGADWKALEPTFERMSASFAVPIRDEL
jgi:hypothetical protein